jgi:2-iminoacetate synthase ThiH
MPISRAQALDYFHSPDLIGLGFEADAVRRRLHPEGVVTYIIDRNINYTNYCTEYCTFCAFYRPLPRAGKPDPRADEGYILDFEKIYEKNRRDPRDGRYRRADAGRHSSRSQDRLVRAAVRRHQAALSADLAALSDSF